MANKTTLMQQKYNENKNKELKIRKELKTQALKPNENEKNISKEIIQKISTRFANELKNKNISDIEKPLRKAIEEECQNIPNLNTEIKLRIEEIVCNTILGNGPIEQYLKDPEVSEIIVQRWDNIVIEKHGKIYKVNTTFSSEEQLQIIIKRIVQRVNRQINLARPIVDARLEDGSRVNATLPPISADGATLTIRKFNKKKLSAQDYIKNGTIDDKIAYFLGHCVLSKISIFVSGGTGTGKTTMLNMLSSFIPSNELIITIEDTLELRLQQENVRRMETRESLAKDMPNINQQTLVKAALRQRPDRIILGEVRDGAIVDLISAMSTGHEGSMSTIHADSPEKLCNARIPILYSMNPEANFSEKSIALQIAETLEIIVQLQRMPDKSRKVVSIASVEGLDKDNRVITKDIFVYKNGKFQATGFVPTKILNKMRNHGTNISTSIFTPPNTVKKQKGKS